MEHAAPAVEPVQGFVLIRAHQLVAAVPDAVPAQDLAMEHAARAVGTAAQDALAVPTRAENNAPAVAAIHALGVLDSAPHLAGEIAPGAAQDALHHALVHVAETATQIVMLFAAVVAAAAVDRGVLLDAQVGVMAANHLAAALVMDPARDGAIPALDAILVAQKNVMLVAPTNAEQVALEAVEESALAAPGAQGAVPAAAPPDAAARVPEDVPTGAAEPAEDAEEPAPLSAPAFVIPLALAVATRRVLRVDRTARLGVTPLAAVRALVALVVVCPAILAAIPRVRVRVGATALEAAAHRAPDVPADADQLAARIVAQIALAHVLRSVSALRNLTEGDFAMKIITKILDEAVVANVERISYELEARKTVIAEMLAMNMDTSTDAFAKYQAELVRYKAMFEEAKSAIEQQYVSDVPGAQKWALDYGTRTLTITVTNTAGVTCG